MFLMRNAGLVRALYAMRRRGVDLDVADLKCRHSAGTRLWGGWIELHETFCPVIHRRFRMEFDGYNVIGGHGTALYAVCAWHHNLKVICLDCLLAVIKRKRSSDDLGGLVPCHVQCSYDSVRFKSADRVTDDVDSAQWKAVAMSARILHHLSGMSNGFVCHTNESAPR
jgi:hypothetical protein